MDVRHYEFTNAWPVPNGHIHQTTGFVEFPVSKYEIEKYGWLPGTFQECECGATRYKKDETMTINKNVTADNLNAVMEFDHVIRVNEDGTVIDSPDSPYMEVSMYKGDDGEWHDDFQLPEGWQLMTGYSGQHGYSGPVMHVSEYIGGGMARDILTTPGDYVVMAVECDCGYTEEYCTEDSGCDCEPAGWVVAFKPLESSE